MRIEREWLRRIPGYGERPLARHQPGEPGAGEAEGLGEHPEGVEALDADAQGAQPAPGAPEAEPGTNTAPGEEREHPAAEPPPLEIPPEIEAQRREQEQRRRQTAQNLNFAGQAFGLEGRYLRRLGTQFARMVSKVAEDSADLPTAGDEEWDLDELLRRRFTGRLVHQCRMTREKRKVAVVLDTSPSCEHQARLFANLAAIAERLGDCELYDAPNFAIAACRRDERWVTLPAQETDWPFRGRVVLAFGDFDGIERICAASTRRGNRIWWFGCEVRAGVLEANRERFVHGYKGRYYPATSMEQLMRAMRRVR